MAHELTRLSRSYLEDPQLIMANRFEEVADVLTKEDRTGFHKLAYEKYQEAQLQSDVEMVGESLSETNLGVLRIEGALTNKPTMFGPLCGLTSYQELIEQTTQLCAMENVNVITMLANSGGGEAFNAFIAAAHVKQLCEDNNKKLITYVDGVAGSACYAWAAVADEIIVHPDSTVGSIGVVVRTVNTSEAEKKEGIKVEYITFGAGKVPIGEDGQYTKDFKEGIQERVDELGAKFITHVSTYRGLPESFYEETGANMFSAEKAISLGLADKVMTNEEFYEYIEQEASTPKSNPNIPSKPFRMETEDLSQTSTELSMTDTVKAEASVDVEMAAQLEALTAQLNKQSEQMEASQKLVATYQAKEEERAKEKAEADVAESLAEFSFLGEEKAALTSFLASNDSSEEAKSLLNSVLASANTACEEATQLASDKIAEAELKTKEAEEKAEQAALAKDKLKEEFGTTEHASTETPTEDLSREDIIKAKVAAKVAAKLAAKA